MTPPSHLPTIFHRSSELENNDTDDETDDDTPLQSSWTTPVGHGEGNEEYHHHGSSSSPHRSVTRPLLVDTFNPPSSPPSLSPKAPEDLARQSPPSIKEKNRKNLASWSDLPKKPQLAILTAARLSEPLVQTSLQSYMFYQLKSFSPALPDSTIASQVGILVGAFTGAQFLTAMLWGRAADSERFGRKTVLLVGLLGTMVSCLGYGFARNFWQAVLCRAAGGALNGNVGVMRTMISEIIKEKRFQSRAFLLLPLCFNIGVIIGPVLGGILADPAGSYPGLFGGSEWLKSNPYAPPNLLSAVFLLFASVAVWLGLEETLPSILDKDDLGIRCGRKLAETWAKFRGRNEISNQDYLPLAEDDRVSSNHSRRPSHEDLEMSPASPKDIPIYTQRLPFRRIFTPNVISTLIAHGLLGCHIGTFNSLWFVFLSTPVSDPAHPGRKALKQHLPFIFTGGLGMPPIHVGTAMAILGFIGITMQLVVYPYVNARLGTVRSWRIFLLCFPVAYILVPFLSLVPSQSPPPKEKDGWRIWVALMGVLLVQVVGRTFVLPAMNILVNNCSPHPSVLGTLHGLGQSVSSGMRTLGPLVGGALYGVGLEYGIIGAVWWGLSGVAIGCVIASAWVSEGDGHEIWLEGDANEDG